MSLKPVRQPEHDGVYVRCVWCNGENYAPNVLPYSKGESSCHQCGRSLPKEYVKLSTPTPQEANELREQIADIVIKYVPSTSVMQQHQKTARENAIDQIEALITKATLRRTARYGSR